MRPQIAKRLWAIQNPITWDTLDVCEAHTAEEACGIAARKIGWRADTFRSLSLPSGREIEMEFSGETLFAANITGLVDPSALPAFDSEAMREITNATEDGGHYIARLD